MQFQQRVEKQSLLAGRHFGRLARRGRGAYGGQYGLRVYVSPLPTPYRFHTFLEDRPYRLSIVTENVAYNQPTQPGFYFGAELERSGKLFRGYQFGK